MKLPLWTLIPSVFFLTLIYLGLSYAGHWNYTQTDLIYGNGLVSLGIGLCYLGEGVYKKSKKIK